MDCFLKLIQLMDVTYNNFERLSYDFLLFFSVNVTALLILPPFSFGIFEIIFF